MPALRIKLGLVVKPLIQELRASSRIDSLSAPSAKIFTCMLEIRSGILQPRLSHAHDPIGCFPERVDSQIRPMGPLFTIAVIYKNRPAAGTLARFHIPPPVPDDKARGEIDVQFARRVEQQPRLGLAAITMR